MTKVCNLYANCYDKEVAEIFGLVIVVQTIEWTEARLEILWKNSIFNTFNYRYISNQANLKCYTHFEKIPHGYLCVSIRYKRH
jgi:hypothetical protein